ncbi:hypothetical protein RHSIM_Rhsim02G0126400 [Rhododendron simsii]|uniref:Uncharacterized protein n=1 Tax=Rhododendron simsii TaxID=118357 RepID=A0A834LVI6_RHOSS|nr:hypothetical protein RHSIM_Rhsim02G0126400 [Rhododendron simsii]
MVHSTVRCTTCTARTPVAHVAWRWFSVGYIASQYVLAPNRILCINKPVAARDLPEYSLYSSLKDGKGGETRVLAAAKGAAFLVQKSLSTVFWPGHEVFDERPDVFEGVKQDLFLALTKLALTICDLLALPFSFFPIPPPPPVHVVKPTSCLMSRSFLISFFLSGRFDRIAFKEDIKAEHLKFLHDVNQTSTKMDITCDVFIWTTAEAIIDISKGKMNFGKYCRLLVRDVGNILEEAALIIPLTGSGFLLPKTKGGIFSSRDEAQTQIREFAKKKSSALDDRTSARSHRFFARQLAVRELTLLPPFRFLCYCFDRFSPLILQFSSFQATELRERYSEYSGQWKLEPSQEREPFYKSPSSNVVGNHAHFLHGTMGKTSLSSCQEASLPETLIGSTIAVMKKMSPLTMYLVLPFHAKRSEAITVVITFFWFLVVIFVSSLHQRNRATHLMMELARCKCACISDTLFYEFWRDIDVSSLEVFNLVSANSLMQLLHDILSTMFNLLEWRNLELCHSTFSATFPLFFGAFGDWALDVIDVVEHADCERRLEGDNFIRIRHLLLGLLSTRIEESVQEFGRFRDDRQESSMRLDLQLTRKGLAVEEYIPVVQEHMFDGFTFDFGNLDTKAEAHLRNVELSLWISPSCCIVNSFFPLLKAFVGQGIANERVKWDVSMAIDMVAVFSEGEKLLCRLVVLPLNAVADVLNPR